MSKVACRHPDVKPEDKYAESKKATDKHWSEAGVEGKPNHLYPDHGKNS